MTINTNICVLKYMQIHYCTSEADDWQHAYLWMGWMNCYIPLKNIGQYQDDLSSEQRE